MNKTKRRIVRFSCSDGKVRNQGIIFSNGMVYTAYDAWRMLSKIDSSSDPDGKWFMTVDDLREAGWSVFRPGENVYTKFAKEVTCSAKRLA